MKNPVDGPRSAHDVPRFFWLVECNGQTKVCTVPFHVLPTGGKMNPIAYCLLIFFAHGVQGGGKFLKPKLHGLAVKLFSGPHHEHKYDLFMSVPVYQPSAQTSQNLVLVADEEKTAGRGGDNLFQLKQFSTKPIKLTRPILNFAFVAAENRAGSTTKIYEENMEKFERWQKELKDLMGTDTWDKLNFGAEMVLEMVLPGPVAFVVFVVANLIEELNPESQTNKIKRKVAEIERLLEKLGIKIDKVSAELDCDGTVQTMHFSNHANLVTVSYICRK